MIIAVVQVPVPQRPREAAEACLSPARRAEAKTRFGTEPAISDDESCVTVDNIHGETIVRDNG